MAFPSVIEKLDATGNKLKVEKEKENYLLIDGNGGLGQLVAKEVIELTIKKAKNSGTCLAGIFNMHSYLMPGYYAKMFAEADMIGIVMNNSKSRVAPFGGIEPKLGTNPLAIAFPTNDIPFVLDMATSKRAMGEVRLAKFFGKSLEKGLCIDENGNETRDPNKVNALEPLGGYKGYGLALAIEVLAGALVRGKMGKVIMKGTDKGYLFLVIDPEIFVDIKTFKREVSDLIRDIKNSKKKEGIKEILFPGERAQRNYQMALEEGVIEVSERVVNDIEKLLK
jgi:LDH2 family malate/lactate/ureidoglycolate dehydrogenase